MNKPHTQNDWIFGNHAVTAALTANRRKVFELWVADADQADQLAATYRQVKVVVKTKADFDNRFKNQVHQGIAANVSPIMQPDLEDVLETTDLLIFLDQVTDPHNLGAILRSADAFGAGAVIIPEHGAAPVTEVVAKTAAGALETVPVITVTNLNQALKQAQKANFWAIGLDGAAEQNLSEIDTNGKIALVMGSEGSGLRRLVAENCDFIAKLPMRGNVESLNVSVATAISLYEITRNK